MILRLCILLLFSLSVNVLFAQLSSSNLPIIEINSEDRIEDEDKVNAVILVYANGPNDVNSLDQSPELVHKIGIELRGQSSLRLYDKKGFGFEFRDADDMDTSVALLGLPAESDWVIHSPYGDKTLMRNAFSYATSRTLFDYGPRTKFFELILNGRYYGVCLLTEKIKMGEDRVDISFSSRTEGDVNGGYILKFDKGDYEEVALRSAYPPILGSKQRADILFHDPSPDKISEQQDAFVESYLRRFEDAMASMSFGDKFRGFRNYIDEESFVDYMLFNELTKNVDAYRISTYFYKESKAEGGRLKAGPVWDYNLAYGNANYCEGHSTQGWAWDFNEVCPEDRYLVHFWWKRFLQDENFVARMLTRWETLRANQLSDKVLIDRMDSLSYVLQAAQVRNFVRWPILGKYIWPNYEVHDTHEKEVEALKSWLIERTRWMDENLVKIKVDRRSRGGVLAYRIFPNPVVDEMQMQVVSEGNAEVTISLYDLLGRQVNQYFFEVSGHQSHQLHCPVPDLQGVYLAEIAVNGRALDRKKVLISSH